MGMMDCTSAWPSIKSQLDLWESFLSNSTECQLLVGNKSDKGSGETLSKLKEYALDKFLEFVAIPSDSKIQNIPNSDTGVDRISQALECVMWPGMDRKPLVRKRPHPHKPTPAHIPCNGPSDEQKCPVESNGKNRAERSGKDEGPEIANKESRDGDGRCEEKIEESETEDNKESPEADVMPDIGGLAGGLASLFSSAGGMPDMSSFENLMNEMRSIRQLSQDIPENASDEQRREHRQRAEDAALK